MGRENKERKAFAALTLSLCLLLSGCAQPPKPVTEAETQTILYTAAGHETGQFSSSCGITPVGDMLLFDRRVRNDNGDVTRVSYYCKDLKTGEETLLGTLNRMYYEPTDSAEAVIGSHVYRMIPLGNWWNMPDKDAELALYDFDLNAKTMQRVGTENYRVTDTTTGIGLTLCAYGEHLLLQKGGQILLLDPKTAEVNTVYNAQNGACKVLGLAADANAHGFSVLMQSAENPSQLSVHTYEESGTLLNIADLSACLQNPDTANWKNRNISFAVQGDYLYFYGYDFGEDAGEKPIYSVLAKIDGETCTEVADFEQSTASFVPSYTAKADGFLFAFGDIAYRFSTQNGWEKGTVPLQNEDLTLREWYFDGEHYWVSAVNKDGSDCAGDGGYAQTTRYCRVANAELNWSPCAAPNEP